MMVMGCTCLCATSAQWERAAWAQPHEDEKRQRFVNEQFIPLSATDPLAAMALGRQYIATNPDKLNGWQRLFLRGLIARQLLKKSPQGPEPSSALADTVLAFLDEGLKEATPELRPHDFNEDILQLNLTAVSILRSLKRWPEAQQRLEKAGPIVPRARDKRGWVREVNEIYSNRGQSGEALRLFQAEFQAELANEGNISSTITLAIAETLVAQNRPEDALPWAKLGFITSNFDDQAIKAVMETLTKVWLAADLSIARAQQFAAANNDASLPNPLTSVSLPMLDTAGMRRRLENTQSPLPVENRIQLLMALGEFRAAMLLARGMVVDKPEDEKAARQVAKVFKAKDTSLQRANQFLAFYGSGEGENPLPAFFKETAVPLETTP
jgi:hypothetical protein